MPIWSDSTVHNSNMPDREKAIRDELNAVLGSGGTSLGVFSVKDHGAVGDGTADDTSAINTACGLAASASGSVTGGIVYLPRGNYKTTAQISVPPNVRVVGEGRDATIITPASDFGSGQYVMACTNRDAGRNVFSGFMINGGGADPFVSGWGNPSWLVRGIAIGSSSWVEKVAVQRVYSGIAVKGNHSTFRDCLCNENFYGIEYEGGTQYGFDNHLFERLWLEDNMKAAFGINGISKISASSLLQVDVIGSPFGFYHEATGSPTSFMNAVNIQQLNCEGIGNFLFFDENVVLDAIFTVTIRGGGTNYASPGSPIILGGYDRGVFHVGQANDCDIDCNAMAGDASVFTTAWSDAAWQMDGWKLQFADTLFQNLTASGKKLGTKPTGAYGYTGRAQVDLRNGPAWVSAIKAGSAGVTAGQLLQLTAGAECDIYTTGAPAGIACLSGGAGDLVPVQQEGPSFVNVPCTGTVSTGDYVKPSATSGSVTKAISFADGPIVGVALGGGTNTSISIDVRLPSITSGSATQAVFSRSGALTVSAGAGRYPVPKAVTVVGVRAAVGTASGGSSIICDVNKNGTTIFTTQANRPTIAAGSQSSSVAVPDVTSLAAGDLISVDIDQIGSTTAGSDLTVVLLVQQ